MGCPQPPPRLNIRVIRDKGMNDGPGNSVVRSCGKATFGHAPSAGHVKLPQLGPSALLFLLGKKLSPRL
jgi:hypothetical protein